MSRQLVISGVPERIRQDGWWLVCSDTQAPAGPGATPDRPSTRTTVRHPLILPLLLVLVFLADWLFWDQNPGLSIALFALALSACVLAVKPGGASGREWAVVLGFQLACNLPVIEQVQILSIMFTLVGVTVLVVWVCYGRIIEWWQALWAMIRVSSVGLGLLPVAVTREIRGLHAGGDVRRQAKALVLPIGVGSVFLVLLTAANPVLERVLDQLVHLDFLTPRELLRGVFWAIVAMLVWPYLNLSDTWLGPVARAAAVKSIRAPGLVSIVNETSVRNSLILFNALFLVQSVMDIGVLTGGMALPEGMTYARYAHRGAYPLVVTALLAGVFAIATCRMVRENRFLMSLMLMWLGQNLFLVFTAAFRLNLYVEFYTLTYLRIAAFIWMGLVFVGLVLIIIQITRSKTVAWLVRSNLMALMGTLYLCCFVNFAHVIAAYNLHHADGPNALDEGYICGLGEQALPSILEHEQNTEAGMCSGDGWYIPQRPMFHPIEDWRAWGFRRWRLQRYLAGQTQG